MTTKTETITTYHCDFCPKAPDATVKHVGANSIDSENPWEIKEWFDVYKTIAKTFHACKTCGHHLHEMLDTLGIAHEFDCNQYGSADKMGTIRILE